MALLEIRNLVIGLPSDADRANAVDDVSFSVESGEVVCLVGESGSGKSMIALSVMGLTPQTVTTRGEISFDGRQLLDLSADQWREIRGARIGMVFQEPMTALNPIMRIGDQIEESLRFHTDLGARARRQRVLELLESVGLPNPPEIAQTYPFRLSGGQRQRVVIAIALALSPKLLIADEPTTALDVTTQAQILTLIRDLQRQHGMGLLFITHDLGIVRDIADRVVVMQRGAAVEVGDAEQILTAPAHPYTQKLIGAVPTLTPSSAPSPVSPVLLSVRNLTKTYTLKATFTGKQRVVRAVDKVSFDIERGKTFGLVGESGSGKSTTGKLITRLASADDGEVLVDGVDISKMSTSELRPYRRRVQIVFQDPFGSLNPRRRVVDLIADGPMAHGTPKAEARDQALELLMTVGLSRDMASRLPHEFSGGQRQRIAIARALALKPELIVADEPVSALDVSVQAQIIELFQDLRRRLSLTMLFITHDLRVAAQLCDRIAVMRSGKVVEIGSASQVLTQPQHEYTRALLASVPGRGG